MRLLRIRQVEDQTGRDDSSIYRDMAAGTFPRSVVIGPNAVAWIEDEITKWCKSRPRSNGTRRPALTAKAIAAGKAKRAARKATRYAAEPPSNTSEADSRLPKVVGDTT
jgi:prophage regulatory protein